MVGDWLSALEASWDSGEGGEQAAGCLWQVKTRLQSEGKHTSADRRYTGSADAVKRIWQTEGAQDMNDIVMPFFLQALQ